MFLWLANWWDGVELWLTELSFPIQFLLVIGVLGPVCLGIAWAIDRAVDLVSNRLTRTVADQPDGSPTEDESPAEEPERPEPADTLSR